MRFVVFGAGGVGGVVGGRLAQHGFTVQLVARGRHYEAMLTHGLRLNSPDESVSLALPVFNHPSQVAWTNDTVVLLAMKSQDTLEALKALAVVAPPGTPIVCAQNGVANERMALQYFTNVYGVCVFCAAGHLVPGVVQAWSVPKTGILDIGRYPSGADAVAADVAAAFRASTFYADVRPDIMRWKYRKLLMNLGNALDALCGQPARDSALVAEARREGEACLTAAGIAFASEDEEPALRERQLVLRPIGGEKRPGGSSWQSLARGTRTIEADYLNGEIVRLGQTVGIATPVNALLQRVACESACDGKAPGTMSIEQLGSMLP